jgi:hypothetical protein
MPSFSCIINSVDSPIALTLSRQYEVDENHIVLGGEKSSPIAVKIRRVCVENFSRIVTSQ